MNVLKGFLKVFEGFGRVLKGLEVLEGFKIGYLEICLYCYMLNDMGTWCT
jgi:hypothetical protein